MVKAGPIDTMGTYSEMRCRYDKSRTSLHTVDLQAVAGLTVKRVTELVLEKGRRNYRLAPSGVGCRFWVKTIVEDLDSAGFIDASSKDAVAQVYNDIQYNYTKDKASEFEPIDPSTFV
ncbi:hypothetical protein TEQG_08327 [Trichophyton equinum CBS 127.97]|nr:hypothetical protein TEQG_08327 [Trichophyton equinum CBS 127.97]